VIDKRRSWCNEFERDYKPAKQLPMWRECFSAIEAALLHIAPVYYGLGSPQGDRSGVILLPGFLGSDVLLAEMYAWLHRLNYRPYFSGIGVNADCPNLILRRSLNKTIDKAVRETGGKVHMIGHSLGGIIAMAAAVQRPEAVQSVITLGSPIRGASAHPNVHRMAEFIRGTIQRKHGKDVLPACYTGHCGCDFVDCLVGEFPDEVGLTSIYTRTDAIVDWKYCLTGDPSVDVEAPGTHLGLVLNPSVYTIVAKRLAEAHAKN